ncbi:hypothetical protein GF406_21400 [candidate division KSB1 bacterium]|nr:hypothetical protein [candidate division KSB1 bacterium]
MDMNMIEIDQQVSDILIEKAKAFGITRNGVLRLLLEIEKPKTNTMKKSQKNNKKNNPDSSFKNMQDELIPYILKILYDNGGKASKSLVEQKIFELFRQEFEKPYYLEMVSHGVTRWKHNIAWSKERAKYLHGFIKSASDSGRGIWELTDKGITYCENNL